MASLTSTDHHNGEEEEVVVVDECRKGHHKGDVTEDSHRYGGEEEEEEYDARSHLGHSSPDGGEEGNARGSNHGGCSHGAAAAVGDHACHSHQWEDIHGEGSETGKDHDNRDAPPEFESGEK